MFLYVSIIYSSSCCVIVVVQSISHIQLFATPWTAAHLASLSLPSPRVCSNSCPLSQWCHPTILLSIIPFSSCLQSFPASESFLMSHLFASSGQSIGASALASVLPMTIQDWFHLGLTGLISLQSKWLSRVFSSTTIWKHQFSAFFMVQLFHPYMTKVSRREDFLPSACKVWWKEKWWDSLFSLSKFRISKRKCL